MKKILFALATCLVSLSQPLRAQLVDSLTVEEIISHSSTVIRGTAPVRECPKCILVNCICSGATRQNDRIRISGSIPPCDPATSKVNYIICDSVIIADIILQASTDQQSAYAIEADFGPCTADDYTLYVRYNRSSPMSFSTEGLNADICADGYTVFPLGMILARGCAVLCASYTDVSPDPDPFGQDGVDQYPFATTNGVFALWGPRDETRTDNPTSIAAWAWALSRGLDLALRQPEIDPERTVVTGCSRLGKAALLAAAFDERFKVCIPNQTGAVGVQLMKRNYGEDAEALVRIFPHWFCRNFRKYMDNEDALPFDQHELVALMAPRPVYIASASEDLWADPKGEWLSALNASPVYALYGLDGLVSDGSMPAPGSAQSEGTIAYHLRDGQHDITSFDWERYLAFARRTLE